MIHHYSKILALVLTPRSFLLAELSGKGGSAGSGLTSARPTILTAAEFIFPDDLSLNTPIELGQALAKFLIREEITTRDTVIGLPARRLLSRRKDLPPASAHSAASTLRLQAETEFPAASTPTGEPDTLVFDYAGQSSSSDPSSVLLVATAQSVIEQCEQIARSAKLKLRAITATSTALALATAALSPDGSDALVLSLASGAAELIVQHGATPMQLRHIAVPNAGTPESLPALAGEIRRSVASLQRNGSPFTLSLWHDSPTQDTSLLAQRLGFPVNAASIHSLALLDGGSAARPAQLNLFAPAIAVALVALNASGSGGLPLDFLHSRLAPPKETSNKRPMALAIAAVAAIAAVIVAGFVDLNMKQNRLDDLSIKSRNQAPQVKIAQAAKDRLDETNRWVHRPQRYVACLSDLTTLFPDEGSIWATSLTFNADKDTGVLTGNASGELQVRALKDLMLKSKKFLDPRVNSFSESGRTPGSEITFSISFTYKPEPATSTRPAATQPKGAKP